MVRRLLLVCMSDTRQDAFILIWGSWPCGGTWNSAVGVVVTVSTCERVWHDQQGLAHGLGII